MELRDIVARWIVNNEAINSYLSMLKKMQVNSDEIIRRAIYPAAGIMADAIKKEVDNLPIVSPKEIGTENKKLKGITSKQKEGLQDSLGISPMKERDGIISAKIGFDGYNSVKTKKFPNGQPNAMIARSINSGTSFREKTQFMDKAIRKNRKKVEKEIEKQLDEQIKKIMNKEVKK